MCMTKSISDAKCVHVSAVKCVPVCVCVMCEACFLCVHLKHDVIWCMHVSDHRSVCKSDHY